MSATGVRTSAAVVDSGGVYNYVPSVMQDGLYRMWWCGSDAADPGDHIFYAQSTSLNGGFHAHNSSSAAYQVVFSPTGTAGTFDQLHTCDPTVLRVNGTYYMYYGGLSSAAGAETEIGLATSSDGLSWVRANGGRPIVVPAQKQDTGNNYGAGQPTAGYYNGEFYLMYTDTTGAASSPLNSQGLPEGAGQYVIRSADPAFQTGVEELTSSGFQAQTAADHTQYSGIGNYYSVDMQFSDALDSWIVAHSDGSVSKLSFFAPDFSARSFADVTMPLSVVEGPGIVSRPDRHSVAPIDGQCGIVPVDIVNATSTPTAPTALMHEGIDLSAGQTCSSMTSAQVANIFEGYALEVPGLPLAYIDGGLRLQSASFPPIEDVTNNLIDTTAEAFDDIPFGGSLRTGATVIGAPGRPAAFLLDNSTKWPTNSAKIISDNGSSITMVSDATYDGYATGPPLYLVQWQDPQGTLPPTGPTDIAFNTGSNLTVDPATGGSLVTGQTPASGTTASIAGLTTGGWEAAVQGADGHLLTVDDTGAITDTGHAMAANSSPSIAPMPSGGWMIAFQGGNTDAETLTSSGTLTDYGLGMAAGTSPALAGNPTGGWEFAFQANTGVLWTHNGNGTTTDTSQAMDAGTSPSIVCLTTGGVEIAYQAADNFLDTHSSSGTTTNTELGMAPGTSPSIAALPGGAWIAAFQANTGFLWSATSGGGTDQGLGMAAGTSPVIAGLGDGTWQIAFQANTGMLWTANPGYATDTGQAMTGSPAIAAYQAAGSSS